MKVWRTKLLPPLCTSPHEQNDAREETSLNDCKHGPSHAICSPCRERIHVEAKRKRECLSSKVEQSADFRRLRLVAVGDVREYVRRDELKADGADPDAHYRSEHVSDGKLMEKERILTQPNVSCTVGIHPR